MKNSFFKLLIVLSIFVLPACFKTRAQLNQESGNETSDQKPKSVDGGAYAIDELKSEFTRLTGRIEELERTQKQGKSGLDENKALEIRIQELEKSQLEMLQTIKSFQLQMNETRVEPTDQFINAKSQFQKGNTETALKNVTSYLAFKGKKTYAEEATFLRGEIHYQLKDYKKAIVDYSKFTDDYGSSALTPKALYKIGLSFDALGSPSDARPFFQDVVEKFPKSAEAKESRKILTRAVKNGKTSTRN